MSHRFLADDASTRVWVLQKGTLRVWSWKSQRLLSQIGEETTQEIVQLSKHGYCTTDNTNIQIMLSDTTEQFRGWRVQCCRLSEKRCFDWILWRCGWTNSESKKNNTHRQHRCAESYDGHWWTCKECNEMYLEFWWVLAGGAGIDLPIWCCKPPELQR